MDSAIHLLNNWGQNLTASSWEIILSWDAICQQKVQKIKKNVYASAFNNYHVRNHNTPKTIHYIFSVLFLY